MFQARGLLSLCASLLFVGATTVSVNADEPEENGSALDSFFQLTEMLPEAVCDEPTISRPPLLTTLEKAKSNREFPFEFELTIEGISEEQVISFLMEDSLTHVPTPAFHERIKTASQGSLVDLKRQMSLEVCKASLNKSSMVDLVNRRQDAFFELKPKARRTSPSASRHAHFVLKDVEDRFGKVEGKWWVAGWIEPYEVVKVYINGREYQRVSNPVTNQLHFVQLNADGDIPLGVFFPTTHDPVLSWERLIEGMNSDVAVRKRVEVYRRLVETEAYYAMKATPQKSEQIKNTQEFFKSLMNAYRIYPSDWRFEIPQVQESKRDRKRKKAAQAKRTVASDFELGLKQAEKLLNDKFFIALSKARANGVRVTLDFFPPDPRLHSMFEEYRKRIQALH